MVSQEAQTVANQYAALASEQKREFQQAAGLPMPEPAALGRLWLLLIGGLVLLAILAGLATFTFFLGNNSGGSTAFLAITTTIVGALVGLLAPSPAQTT